MAQTAAWAAEITEGRGYVLIPDLVSPSALAAARARLLEAAACQPNHHQRQRLYGLIYQDPLFANLAAQPQVLAVIEAILGRDLVLGGFSAHVLHPGAGRMGIHVDYPYWAMPDPLPAQPILEVQTIWLLEDFTAENGAPYFVPGSQRWCCRPEPEKFAALAEQITGPAGSVLISHGLAWHDTGENRSAQPRLSLLGNYTPKFIQPLEDNGYGFEPQAAAAFSPRLKQLLRFALKPALEPIYLMSAPGGPS